jgi:tripartite-type tricarboxylate transporter receptor subunit TctC
MNRRAMLAVAAEFAAALPALVMPINEAMAQTWPQRSVKLILPLGAGSGLDLTARLFAERLSARWGQPVVIENRPGGDSIVAISAFVGAKDDHVLLVAAGAMFTPHPHTHQSLPYDARRDLVPIAGLTRISVSIAANQALTVNSLADLVTLARTQPGKLNWAAITSMDDFLFAGFLKQNELTMVRVPYPDPIQALNDLSEGRIDVVMAALGVVLPRVQAGKAKVLAIANPQRSPLLPDVPTAAEAGVPALTYDPVIGLFAPHGMTAEVRERIAADLRAVAGDPAIATRLAPGGQIVNFTAAADFAGAIERERDNLAALVQMFGVKPTQ